MRTYFDFELKGKKLFPYFMAGWAAFAILVAVMVVWKDRHEAAVYLNASYLGQSVVSLLHNFLIYLMTYLVMFFTVSFTMRSLSLRGERPECEYDFGKFAGIVVRGALLSVVTLGIYFPWFITKMIRYFADNTYFLYNRFGFGGSPANLFALQVLLVLLPAVMLFVLLIMPLTALETTGEMPSPFLLLLLPVFVFFMSLYQAFYVKWLVNFAYGPKRVAADIKIWHAAFFFFGQFFLSMVTLGIYMPMAMLRSYRYVAGRVVLGDEYVEDRLGFAMLPWRDFFYIWGQLLLTFVTLGVYGAWAYAKVTGRILRRTYIDALEEQTVHMPSME